MAMHLEFSIWLCLLIATPVVLCGDSDIYINDAYCGKTYDVTSSKNFTVHDNGYYYPKEGCILTFSNLFLWICVKAGRFEIMEPSVTVEYHENAYLEGHANRTYSKTKYPHGDFCTNHAKLVIAFMPTKMKPVGDDIRLYVHVTNHPYVTPTPRPYIGTTNLDFSDMADDIERTAKTVVYTIVGVVIGVVVLVIVSTVLVCVFCCRRRVSQSGITYSSALNQGGPAASPMMDPAGYPMPQTGQSGYYTQGNLTQPGSLPNGEQLMRPPSTMALWPYSDHPYTDNPPDRPSDVTGPRPGVTGPPSDVTGQWQSPDIMDSEVVDTSDVLSLVKLE